MKKQLIVVMLIMVLVAIPGAMAFRDVTCGPPNDKCVEGELQDEFNEVENMIEDVEDDVKDNDHDIWHLKKDVNDIEDDVKHIERTNDKQWHVIGDTKDDVDDLENTISTNDAKWSKDSSGTSMRSVKRLIFGDNYEDFELENLLDYLKGLFATKTQFEELEDKMYIQEARLFFLENGLEYDEDKVLFKAIALEMEDKGTDGASNGEYHCSASGKMFTCLRSVA